MLKDKSINATVSHTVVEPTTQHPVRVVNFSIDDPVILLTQFKFEGIKGITKEQEMDMYRVMSAAANRPYVEGLAYNTVDDRILAGPRDLGFITAKIDDLQRTVQPSPHGYSVNLTGSIILGEPYKLSTLSWTPTPIYSATDFTRDTLLHPGDVASQKLLLSTEGKILAAYRAQGYMDAYLHVTPAPDTTAHTVTYDLTAAPGEQYHLKTITVVGLAPDARQQFDSGWRMQPGDLYNEPYIQHFLNNNSTLLKLNNYVGSYQASADPNTHLVDLIVTFVSKANWRP
jgi:outer membrane protein assembly factor BamA